MCSQNALWVPFSSTGSDAIEAELETLRKALDSQIVVLNHETDSTKTMCSILEPDSHAGSELGTQFGESADPQLILIMLETGLICIELTKYGKIARQKIRDHFEQTDAETEEMTVTQAIDKIESAERETYESRRSSGRE